MEELLGSLFVLYILGSIVAGFFRRGSGSRSDGQGPVGGPERPGFPEVLDMDELERRLREVRSGKREPDTTTGPSSAPEPFPRSTARPAAPPARAPRPAITGPAIPGPGPSVDSWRPTGADGWSDDADDWGDLPDDGWDAASGPTEGPRPDRTGQMPAAVETFIRQGNPWQAAFVVKELLGPPRALQPHRRRPF